MNDETVFPDWLTTEMAPGGGYGPTIWAHSPAGVDTSPWPLGPASTMSSLSASATSSSSASRPSAPVSR
jgi:hypothetical protein